MMRPATLSTILAAVSAFAALAGAGQEERASSSERDQTILRELAAIRSELQSLRTEIRQLQRAVARLQKSNDSPDEARPELRIDLGDDPALGDPEAKVAVVEFSDYQCPYCERFHHQTLPQLKEKYVVPGKVRYVFRDFPLTEIHPQAMSAAVAANCAGEQGFYWQMHDALFRNRSRLGPELYGPLAAELGLDGPKFESCLENPTQEQEVQEDRAYGEVLGVTGTPYYFVGRIDGNTLFDVQRINGAQPFAVFANVIEPLLK